MCPISSWSQIVTSSMFKVCHDSQQRPLDPKPKKKIGFEVNEGGAQYSKKKKTKTS